MSGAYLDLSSWPRRGQFEFFRNYDQPFFNITSDVRVTEVYRLSRETDGPSFFLATLYLSLVAANRIEEFRLRLRPAGVWCHDRIHGGSTILRSNETFGFGYFRFIEDFKAFQARGRAVIAEVRNPNGKLDAQEQRDDLMHYSVLPWIRFTSFAHARKTSGTDSIPKIVFGKRFERAGDVWMPISVEVHHALVDGLHVGRFLEAFEAELAGPRL
ncbi:MAG TPA: chloramphenicol acetyltransferase [Longimicrobiales bacterium]|nr:chloramphenicol acetyltransferase [Longimicrobiales bacterium]